MLEMKEGWLTETSFGIDVSKYEIVKNSSYEYVVKETGYFGNQVGVITELSFGGGWVFRDTDGCSVHIDQWLLGADMPDYQVIWEIERARKEAAMSSGHQLHSDKTASSTRTGSNSTSGSDFYYDTSHRELTPEEKARTQAILMPFIVVGSIFLMGFGYLLFFLFWPVFILALPILLLVGVVWLCTRAGKTPPSKKAKAAKESQAVLAQRRRRSRSSSNRPVQR